MAPPSPQQVQVATGALRTEAAEWDHQSAAADSLAQIAAQMELGRVEAGLFQLVVGPYNDVVHAVTGRCREATEEFRVVAQTLRTVADTYEREDRAGEHRFRKLY